MEVPRRLVLALTIFGVIYTAYDYLCPESLKAALVRFLTGLTA